MTTKLQCIYTFCNREQVIIDFGKLPKIALDNEKNFIAYAKTSLTNPEENELIKISACIMTGEKPPEWYMKCNGKFYFN